MEIKKSNFRSPSSPPSAFHSISSIGMRQPDLKVFCFPLSFLWKQTIYLLEKEEVEEDWSPWQSDSLTLTSSFQEVIILRRPAAELPCVITARYHPRYQLHQTHLVQIPRYNICYNSSNYFGVHWISLVLISFIARFLKIKPWG